jgi:hypothetical protein
MAVTINASTSAGLVQTADTSGVLALQTAGTTAVSISSGQVVTLTNALPVASGGSGVTTSTGTGANVLGTTPSFTSTIGVGAATASASGAGITFPATQSASSDANTLDDYEEGTWTPTAAPATGSFNGLTTGGWYVKVGRSVTVFCYWNITASGNASGSLSVGGLPFTVLNTGTYGAGSRGGLMLVREDGVTGVALQAYWNNNTTNGAIQKYDGTSPSLITNYVYIMSGTYETAS